LLALLLVLGGVIGKTRGTRAVLAASLMGAIVSLLVAYQATNALHFATNWLLLGLAMAVAWGRDEALTADNPS
jgi:threonine/homoserine efflux transporter RhtA